MTREQFKIIYERQKRWHQKFRELARSIPPDQINTERSRKILNIWWKVNHEMVRIYLLKDDQGDYLWVTDGKKPKQQP